jgi:hypothetical protein
MMQMDEAGLAAYVDKLFQRKYNRLVLNRFFQGIVTAVSPGAWDAAVGAFVIQVQIQRIGEAASDGNWYACTVPGYYPVIGDRVELVWRDDVTAHVFAPIGTSQGALSKIAEVAIASNAAVASQAIGGNIPQVFRSLCLRWRLRADNAVANNDLYIRLNGDAGANYDSERGFFAAGSAVSADFIGSTVGVLGYVPGTSAPASYFGRGEAWVEDYRDPTSDKEIHAHSTLKTSIVSGGTFAVTATATWRTVNAAVTGITLLQVGANFYGWIGLYGLP